jgi:hypothetical protein
VNVTSLEPDSASGVQDEAPQVTSLPGASRGFAQLLDGVGAALERADRAENAFGNHRGGLVEMMVERASADVMLGLATSAAQRTTQAVSTLLGMQV